MTRNDEKQMDRKIKEYIKRKFKKHEKIIYVFLTIIILLFVYMIFFNKTSNVYLKGNAQKSDLMSVLMNEMSSMNSRISNEVGWMMTIISIIMGGVGLYSYNQWKMSANQINILRKEFKDQFHIDYMQHAIRKMEDKTLVQQKEIKKSKKINKEMKKSIKEVNEEFKENSKNRYIEEIEKISEKNYGENDGFSILGDIMRMNLYLFEMEAKETLFNKPEIQDIISSINVTFMNVDNFDFSKNEFEDAFVDIRTNCDEILQHTINISKGFDDEVTGDIEDLKDLYSKMQWE